MRYLITGIAGFAGGHLAGFLLDRGHEPLGLVRSKQELSSMLGGRVDVDAVVTADVCERDAVAAAVERLRPDGIFHLAAQSSVSQAEGGLDGTFVTNTVGTLNVLAVAARRKIRVLVVSSGECYGRAATSQPASEDLPLRPVSLYAASKAVAELLVRHAIDAYAADALCARAFNHTGPHQTARFVCADLARQIVAFERGQQAAVRVGNLDAVRDFLDVRDVVPAYLRLWERGEAGAAYNVASGVGRRIADILEILCRASLTRPVVEADPLRLRPAEVPVLIGDNRRMRALGWEPERDWNSTLAEVLADWRRRSS